MLKVFNTLGHKKETFTPLKQGTVKMYVCGVTVYDDCHLGHGRAYVSFDVIRRYLEYSGYKVTYIQNFTDIDDKIIKRANEENKTVEEIARIYTEKYFAVMDRLNVKRADFYPEATGHIPDMIEAISSLIKNGFAYVIEGDVYFRIKSLPSYGELSGRNIEDMKAGARVEVDDRKEHPLDFALWKAAKEGEPFWRSPWGGGRPGWHIECTAMSTKYLGESFDIHGGGIDLIFPHHENELSQAYGINGKKLSRYWLHNGFVTIDKEKMSKSLKNFFTLEEIFKKFDPEAVRYFLISTHYRSPLDFSEDKLKEAEASLDSLYQTFRQAEGVRHDLQMGLSVGTVPKQFTDAMDNDFNTPEALGTMHELSRDINQAMNNWYREKKGGDEILKKCSVLRKCGEVLGLFFKKHGRPDLPASVEVMAPHDKIEELIALRETARKNKQWQKADEFRKKLQDLGVIIEDTPKGTRWYKKKD